MFRKIHSNRNPENTIASELCKEFAVHFNKVWGFITALLKKYPKPAFALMILFMLGSMVLSFTVLRNIEKKEAGQPVKSLGAPVQNGFSQIMQKGAALQESIAIKRQIEALISKDSLTGPDSIRLERAIDRLHQLTIIANKHEQH
jgi:hypothetical protein